MAIENEFSDENVREYARACFNIAESLVERSQKDDFNTLLIPSRGAVPFFIGSMYVLQCLGNDYEDHHELADRINIPNLIREYVMPADVVPAVKSDKRKVNILLCPFTADINMQPFAQDVGLEGKLSVDEFVNDTRKYWTKVVHALTEGKKGRAKDPYLQFYLYLLRNVENRAELAFEYETAERVDGIAMIDTVISGRASTTILDGFKEEGILPYSLLVIDNNGRNLKEPYSTKIRIGESYGNIKPVHVPRIFTEDRGASLEGVFGIVYPSLMFYANGIELKKEPFFPVGAGSWYHLPGNNPHEKAFKTFCEMLKSAITIECADYSGCVDKSNEEKKMVESRKELVNILKSNKLLVSNHAPTSFIKLRLPIQRIYETSSHVVHICFSPEISRNVVNKFRRKFEYDK